MEVAAWFLLCVLAFAGLLAVCKVAERQLEQFKNEQYFIERNYERR